MQKVSRYDLDSFNFYPGTDRIEPGMSYDEKEQIFREAYRDKPSRHITSSQLKDLEATLPDMKFVLVAENPGFAGKDEKYPENFHGIGSSNVQRLATLTYGTPLWGAFMTDASLRVDSHGENIDIAQQDIDDLLNHLKERGIPESDVLVAIGDVVEEAFSKFLPNHRKFFKITHYSDRHQWDFEEKGKQLAENLNKFN